MICFVVVRAQAGIDIRALNERVVHSYVSFFVFYASSDVAYIIESERNAGGE